MQLRFSHDDSLECVHFQRPVGCFYVTWPRLADCARPGKVLIYKKDFGTVCFTMTMTRSLGKLPIQTVLALAVFEGHGNFPHRHFCRQLRKHDLGTLWRGLFFQSAHGCFHREGSHRGFRDPIRLRGRVGATKGPRVTCLFRGSSNFGSGVVFECIWCVWFILSERKNSRIWASGSYDFGLNSH